MRSLFIILMLLFAMSSVSAFSGSGSGTSGDPYQITTCEQFAEISSEQNAHYELMNDIDCDAYNAVNVNGFGRWDSLGGSFNGNFHTIENLYRFSTSSPVTLMFSLDHEYYFENVTIKNARFVGGSSFGDAMDNIGFAHDTSGRLNMKNVFFDNFTIQTDSMGSGRPYFIGVVTNANNGVVLDRVYGTINTINASGSPHTGDLMSSSAYVYPDVGLIASPFTVTVRDSYAYGIGVLGNCAYSGTRTVSNAYSGNENLAGSETYSCGTENSSLSESDMMNESTFGGLDFVDTWYMPENGFPTLQAFATTVSGVTINLSSVSVDADDEITFDLILSPVDADVASYYWDFDNGDTSSSRNGTVSFSSGGSFDVSVVVTDVLGNMVSDTVSVSVTGATLPSGSGPFEFEESTLAFIIGVLIVISALWMGLRFHPVFFSFAGLVVGALTLFASGSLIEESIITFLLYAFSVMLLLTGFVASMFKK